MSVCPALSQLSRAAAQLFLPGGFPITKKTMSARLLHMALQSLLLWVIRVSWQISCSDKKKWTNRKALQSCLWVQSAPLPLSSSAQSGRQLESAAPEGLSPSFSGGYPNRDQWIHTSVIIYCWFWSCNHVIVPLTTNSLEHTSKSTLSPSGILGAASCVTSGL